MYRDEILNVLRHKQYLLYTQGSRSYLTIIFDDFHDRMTFTRIIHDPFPCYLGRSQDSGVAEDQVIDDSDMKVHPGDVTPENFWKT